LKLLRQIITNKIFLLVLLIGIFLLLSSFRGGIELEEKSVKKENRIVKETLEEDTEKAEIENAIEINDQIPTKDSASPTSVPAVNQNIDAFIYPNGSVVNRENSSFTIESNDTPEQIVDWYRSKINEHDMNSTSVVQTNTNGNVLNKLAASSSTLSIEVEISRSNSSNTTKITGKLL